MVLMVDLVNKVSLQSYEKISIPIITQKQDQHQLVENEKAP